MFVHAFELLRDVFRLVCLFCQVKPKVEQLMYEELKLKEAVEDALGKENVERELDKAFEAAGGENADLSKVFPEPTGGNKPVNVDVSAFLDPQSVSQNLKKTKDPRPSQEEVPEVPADSAAAP